MPMVENEEKEWRALIAGLTAEPADPPQGEVAPMLSVTRGSGLGSVVEDRKMRALAARSAPPALPSSKTDPDFFQIARNNPTGRICSRKKCPFVITLAASLTASGSADFRVLTRSR